jgi:hypothetical protein
LRASHVVSRRGKESSGVYDTVDVEPRSLSLTDASDSSRNKADQGGILAL